MIEADYPGQIARRHGALIDYLEPQLAARGITLDHAQWQRSIGCNSCPTSSPSFASRASRR
jgi:hypothetical protein